MATTGHTHSYNRRLNAIYKRIHEAQRYEDLLPLIEDDVLYLLGAERLILYRREAERSDLVAYYRVGDEVIDYEIEISPASIPGYVAMTQQPMAVDDVHDFEALSEIHPELTYDDSYDLESGIITRNTIAVPIAFRKAIIGVLQVMNRLDGEDFTDQDVIHALAIGQVIGQRFAHEVETGAGPFDMLVRNNKLSLDELRRLEAKAEKEGVYLTRMLIKAFNLTPEEIGASLEDYYQVPYMEYDETLQPDLELLNNLNISYLARNCWVPLTSHHGEQIVLIDDPHDTDRIMEIQYLLNNEPFELRVGMATDIMQYLGFEVDDSATEINVEDLVGRLNADAKQLASNDYEEEDEDLLNENLPTIIQLVNRLIVDAVDQKASDIHLEPSKNNEPAMVRMRVDGECRPYLQIPSSHVRAVIARIKVLSRLDISERRLPQDGKMSLKMRGAPLELRVATVPTVNGESVVMRVLASGDPMPLDKINLTPEYHARVIDLVEKPYGLFLVVGPTGSGKTTTLHAILGHINTPIRKIWTAEDPVEITQNGLQQVQMQPKIGLNFASALRSFLRADPDVILIGEMRDYETAHIGIEASLTGHMVFSTLHTNTAPETVVRLLDMGIDPMNFADALVGVLAQRLVRTLCRCKEAYQPTNEELERLIHFYGEDYFPELGVNPENCTLYRPKGCEICGGSGYKGRTGIHEFLEGTPTMRRLVATKAAVGDIRDLALNEGMRSLVQDGVRKVFIGQTDILQVRKVTA